MNKQSTLERKNIAVLLNGGKALIAVLLLLVLCVNVAFGQQASRTAQPLPTIQSGASGKLTKPTGALADGIEDMLHKFDKQLYFTQNKGQWKGDIKYRVNFSSGQALATSKGMLVGAFDPASVQARADWMMEQERARLENKPFSKKLPNLKGHGWLMEFTGSSPAMTVGGKDVHGDVENYFIGQDPSKHATDVQSYGEVWYNNVYNNIDVRYYPSAEGQLEYDVIVKPGANPADIAIKFGGIKQLELTREGHLVFNTSVGQMDMPEPYAYQTINGKEVKVEASYALNENNELTFVLGKYDYTKPLIIDPIALRWATWMNNNSGADSHGHGIWVDSSGNIYVVARLDSGGLITVGAFDSTANGSVDVAIGKYTEPTTVGGAGTRVWQTYVGGGNSDNPYVTEMGPDGNLYVAGITTSGFPLIGGSGFGSSGGLDYTGQTSDNSFIMKINAAGNSIKAAVIGGNGGEDTYDLRFTPGGSIVVVGATSSTNLGSGGSNLNFPQASNTNNGGDDFWMYQINADLSTIAWMRNWGGSDVDRINIININTNGDIYAGGYTESSGLSLVSPRQGTYAGDADDGAGYLAKMNSTGVIQWSSYFNSSSNAAATRVLCMEFNQAKNAIYFGGTTEGLATSNISSSGVYDNSYNGGTRDFYVAKMDLNQNFAYSTYIGSSGDENNMMGLNVDANDDVYVFGYSYGTNFPTAGNPFQSSLNGEGEKVFLKLENDLSALLYSTYYGGTNDESDPVGQRGIKFSNCRIYTIVTSESADVPLTQGALTTSKSSPTDRHEPGVVVWANPPDLNNNNIGPNQNICSGGTPALLDGQTPNYVLPTITRNGSTASHPALTSGISYQWQRSTDNISWTNISGATGEDLTPAQMGALTQTTYFRRVFNGDACVVSPQSNVKIGVFTISASVTNNPCFGGTAGSVTITPTDGTSGYQYQLGSGAFQSSGTFNNLAAGTYTINAKDANNCTATVTFTITQPTQIQFTATPANATCGAANGSIVVSGVSGGSGSGYTYSKDGTTYQGGTTFSGLTAGTYTIYVKDGSGCVRSQSVTVGSANALVASISAQTNVDCRGNSTGAVTVTSTGGTAPYQYQLGSGSFGSSATFSGLAAGSYTVTVRDANNCTSSVNVTITQPTAVLSGSISSQTNVLCFGNSTGAVTIAGAGGTSPYQYKIGSGAYGSANTFSGLAAGSYVVTIKDANNCTTTVNVTITQPASAVSVSISSTTNAACGASNGALTAVGAGGTSPYQYQIGSGSFQPSGTFSGLAGGSYTITVKDANNCTSTVSATINNNAGPTISVTKQINVDCRNNATGEVTLGQAGGTAPYQYQIGSGAFQSSSVFGGLTAGTYTFTVKDANNCTSSINVTITQPAAVLSGSITSQTNVLCFGASTGAVTVAGAGGTSPYQYQLGSGSFQSSGTFSALAAGSYVVTVKDANGCTVAVNVTITQPSAAVSGSITSQINVDCRGNATGAVTIAGAGGVGPYTYQLGSGSFQSSGTFSGMAAGSYTVTVKDANNCTATVSVTITQPSANLSASISSQTNVLCFGDATGAVTVAAAGGTSPYQYQLGSGLFQGSGTFSGLTAGTYVVTVKDANNCTATVNITITQPAARVSGSITAQTNVACNGGNGSVTVAGSGGVAPYQYQLGSGSFQSSGSFSALAAGSYVVTVKDANNCTATVNVTITQPSSLAGSITSQTNVLCFGNSTGAVTVAGSGGSTPYQYQLGSGAFQSSGTFTGLAAGSYVVTVKDANNCTFAVNVTITQPTATLSGSITSQTNVDCNGNSTGAVTVAAAGGTSGYLYKIGAGAFQASGSFSGLAAGSYTITIQDANNCTVAVPVTITQPNTLTVGIANQTNVLCFGNSTGAVTVSANGGTTAYQYKLGSGSFQSSGTFSGLAAGSYVITVQDAKGCTATVNVTITQPAAPLSGNITSQTNVDCFGNSTGAVTVVASGGTSAYQYKIGSGTFQSSGTFTGLTVGNYIVTIQDANGCSTTVPVSISQPSAALSAAIGSQTNVLCFGGNNGSVSINATGGTPTYQYKIGAGSYQSSNTFAGLTAGAYVVTVKDANNCTTTVNVTITQPSAAVSVSIGSQTNVLCFGNSTGAVTVVGAGGTPAYQYAINGGSYQSSATFNNLAAGSYSITVKDANNCTSSVNVTITQPAAPLAATIGSQTNAACAGATTGAVTISATGGAGSYQYQLGSGSFQTSATFSNLAAGSYTVTVKDANNCTAVVNVTITEQNSTVSGSITSQTNVLCFGNSTGAVTVAGANGVAPYQYSINGGAFQSSGLFSGLAAGNYFVTVKDANGCTGTVSVSITQPSAPVAGNIANQVNVLCFGDATGAVTVAGSGGVGPYTYKIGSGSFQSSGTFTGLIAGNYVVTVKDNNGCTATVNVSITQPVSAVSISVVNQTNVLCFGASTGSVTVSASGGVAPTQFNINGGTYSASNVFSNLAAGTYTIGVKDANGCTSSVQVTITQPSAPVGGNIVNQTNADCNGGVSGSVTVAGSGGTAPYQYSLSGGAFQSSGAFTGLAAGNYTVIVKDNNGCTFNVPVSITQPNDAVSGTIISQTNVSCFGGNNGAAVVSGVGGTPGYTYSFDGGAFSSNNSFSNLVAGQYDVTVKDANGCTYVVTLNITQPSAPLNGSITAQTNVSCFGGSNGSVTVAATGGTAPYQYKIGSGAFQSSGTFSGLAAGVYVVTIRDAKQCTKTINVVITQPADAVTGVEDNVTPVACFGNASGSFSVIGQGGVAPYTYSFNGGAFNSSNSYVGLIAGTYSVVVKDANGCLSPAVVVTISQPSAPLSAGIGSQTNILCFGASTGAFSINASGGTAPYQYSFNGGAYSNQNSFSGLTAGTYIVVVKDNNGCTSSPVQVTLTQPSSPVSASITSSTNILCYGANTGAATVVAVGGVAPYSYSWNTIPVQTGATAAGLTAGTYIVTVTDNNGCSVQRSVTISQPAAPISVSLGNVTNVSCRGGNNGSATVVATGGTGVLSYSWNTNPVQNTATATNLTAGNYIVTVTDANGCSQQLPVTITQPASSVSAALVSQTNVRCFGDNNGLATIAVAGGTGTINVVWNTVPQQTGLTASGLNPGTYVATATDANGCFATVVVTITGPTQPLASSIISSSNETCFGFANGNAAVSATGGTFPYSYSWSTNPVQSNALATGLAQGTYTVVVSDANNCITSSNITISGPAAPVTVAISNQTNVACRGDNSGSATAAASGGTGALNYVWNTVPQQTGPTATGLVAGTYVVTVTDAFGCSANTSVTITQPATVLTASLANSVNPSCFGAANGSATITVSGGNGPYTTVWNTVPQQTGLTATGLIAGNYVAAVTDQNGCTRFVNVTLTQPAQALSGSIINSQNVLCFGDSSGSATVSVTGGTAPYSYSWNSVPAQTGSTASNLPAGTYVVTVTDAQGCSLQRSVTITQPATPISVSLVSQANVLCFGGNNGSATVSASGGTGALSYTWNTVPQQIGVSAFNLVAGSYVVTVRDAFGCEKELTVVITQPAAPLNAVINDRTNVLCFGTSTGSATVTVGGGTPNYSYSWNTNPVQTTATASNLAAGTYVVTVTDANGCSTNASVTISQPATPVNASITNFVNVKCYGDATGSATVSAVGGVGPYSYSWNTVPLQTSATASGLVAGTYTVRVTDANGCFVERNVTISQPAAPLAATISNSVNVCPTFATGSATVSVTGGTSGYLYSWNTVPVQQSATATGLAAGSYTVTVTDANGCSTTASIDINNNPKPQAGGDQSICEKEARLVAAGVGESWSLASGPVNASVNSQGAVSGMNVGGVYMFILTNQFGCQDTVLVTTTANCPLIANPDNATTNEDTPVVINVPSNDVDPDGNINVGSVTITDQPDHGTVVVNANGSITYTPNNNYNGPDSFIYNICDFGSPVYCDTALVTINVVPVNDPPVANQDTTSTPEDTPVVINVPDNDTDPEGNIDTTTVTIIDPPNHGTVTVDTTTGDITYVPDPNYNGPDTLIYEICDTGMPVLCDTAIVVINVQPVNDPPIANIDHASTLEDVAVNIPVPNNDTDVDGNLNTGSVTIVEQPSNGVVIVNADGSITYDPNPNFFGNDTLVYQICDTGMPIYCDTALVIINVGDVNDPPVANIDHASTNEDTPVTVIVPGNDTDVDGNLDPTSVTIVDQPNNGTATVDPITGAINYTPNTNFNGVDTLIYNICDTGMPILCDTALVIINVEPVNDPPIANQDNASTNEDTPVVINVPGNDTDVDGNLDPTSVTIVDQPNNGIVTVDPVTGAITYTPNTNFNGVDTLIYNICDTGMPVLCDTALVIINVNPINDPPIANQDNASTPEDTPVVINVPSNDTDNDGNLDPTSVTVVDQPNHGTVTIDPVTGDITYTPNPNYNGPDTLIYQICDTGMPVLCDTAIVVINVEPVNDPPIANQDNASTNEDTPVVINVPGNDTDVDGNLDPTSVTIVDQPNNGIVTVDPVTGAITYTPNTNFNGVDTLIYNICDTGMPVLCDTALVIINVNPINDPPIANQDNASTMEDTPVVINVPGNDTDPDGNLDPTSVTIVDQPNNGTVTVDPVTGDITYTPNPDFNGTDSLIYQICDTGMPVMCDTAYVVINVERVNDPPIANQDNAFTMEDSPVTINVPNNDTDVDGNLDNTSVTIVDQPNHGSVVVNPDGSIIYTPNPDYNGVDSLIYNICDTGMPVLCDTAYVIINVEPVNDPIIAILDTDSTSEDTPVTILVPANDIDVDGNIDYTSVVIVDQPNNGTVTVDPVTGAITYTPNLNFNGVDSLIYNICDMGAPIYCDTAYVIITVGPVNDPPVAITDTATTIEEVPVTIGIEGNDYDVDGNLDPNSVVIVIPPVNGSAIFNPATDSLIYTPGANFNGVDSLLYQICDTDGLCDTAWVYITVRGVPDLTVDPNVFPAGTNISCFGANDGAIDLTVDPGTLPITISWTGPNGFTSNQEDLTGLAPGTYIVVVTNGDGISATAAVTLTEPTALQSSIVAQVYNNGVNISCANACDGNVNLTVSGGSQPYSYLWVGPNGFTANTEDLSSICAGTYVVTITDLNGCSLVDSITLVQPDPLVGQIETSTYAGGYNISCNGACNGSIDLSIGGGSAPYTVSWINGTNVYNTQDLSNLCAGTYNLTITDANGCTYTTSVTLTQPDTLAATAVAATFNGGVNVSCANACDGSINMTVSGGATPYSISWVGPNGFAAQTEDLSGLCPGTYTATITDANGCATSSTVVITAPTPLNASAVAATFGGGFNTTCNGVCDGSIDVTVTGGTAPYTYTWIGLTSNLQDVDSVCAGSYSVIVTDANGCSDTVAITLTAAPSVDAEAVVTPSACGLSNGAIDLTPTGGAGGYSFDWVDINGTQFSTSEDVSGLASGQYCVTITDINGCSNTICVNVLGKPPVVFNGAVTNATCGGTCNGTIALEYVSGQPGFTFNWTGPNGPFTAQQTVVNACPGNYTVEVVDANGCSATYNFTITSPAPLNIAVDANNSATCSASNGSVSITVTGGSGQYAYQWSGNGITNPTAEDQTGLPAGSYVVTVTDTAGCQLTQTITIGASSGLAVNSTVTNPACNGVCNGVIELSIPNGAAPFSTIWSTGAVDSLAQHNLCAGTYVVQVTDANGCSFDSSFVLTEPAALVVAADVVTYPNGYNVSGITATDGTVDLTVSGGVGPYTYMWHTGVLPDSTAEDQFSLQPDTFQVVITDANGCTITEEYIIEGPPIIELPTGFSPDGDGKNDYYVIHGIEKLLDNEFTVFNRWGQVIFNEKGYNNDWAGTNFQGEPMPDGTYFILFTVNVPNQGEQTFKVTVELRANFKK